MTEEQFQKARELRCAIAYHKENLGLLEAERNIYALPEDLWTKQQAEKHTYLKGELLRVETAFADL